jgi:hypothetical protein
MCRRNPTGMAEENSDVPQDKRIEFRIGIHVGDIPRLIEKTKNCLPYDGWWILLDA